MTGSDSPPVWDPEDASWEAKDFGPEFEPYGVGKSMQGSDFAERALGRSKGREQSRGQPGGGA